MTTCLYCTAPLPERGYSMIPIAHGIIREMTGPVCMDCIKRLNLKIIDLEKPGERDEC